jgi:hypothetical protein
MVLKLPEPLPPTYQVFLSRKSAVPLEGSLVESFGTVATAAIETVPPKSIRHIKNNFTYENIIFLFKPIPPV